MGVHICVGKLRYNREYHSYEGDDAAHSYYLLQGN